MELKTMMDRARETGRILYETAGIPVYLINQNHSTLFPPFPDFHRLRIQPDIQERLMQEAKKRPCLELAHPLVLYFCFGFEENGQFFYLFLGPAKRTHLGASDIEQLFPYLEAPDPNLLLELEQYIPICPPEPFTHLSELLYLSVTGRTLDLPVRPVDLMPKPRSLSRPPAGRFPSPLDPDRLPPSDPFANEQNLCACIRSGNAMGVKALFPHCRPLAVGKNRSSLDQVKNRLIYLAHLGAHAARTSGMSPDEALGLCEAAMLRGENGRTVFEVDGICSRLLCTYAERIAMLNEIPIHSPAVEQCIQHIRTHLYTPMTVRDLAQLVHLSPNRLSTVFHREMGVTLTAFLQQERVHEAKNLLRFSHYSYSEIGAYLNFVSQSYFIKVFKRYTGMTPQEYRRSCSETGSQGIQF